MLLFLYCLCEQDEYMALNEEKQARQMDLEKMIKATQEALKIISDTYVT